MRKTYGSAVRLTRKHDEAAGHGRVISGLEVASQDADDIVGGRGSVDTLADRRLFAFRAA